MSVYLLARGCRAVLPGVAFAAAVAIEAAFVLAVVALLRPTSVVGQPPPKPDGAAWTFDEARDRLALSPHDTYLQYVVLQLGRRDGRLQEAQNAVDPPNRLRDLFGDGGRRARADLFSTFTGALAVQETLQLDTMRGEPDPNRPRRPNTPEPKQPAAGKVAVRTLAGPTQPSHPWEKMLGGKTPDVGPLAGLVPEEYYLAECRSAVRLHEVLGTGELWSGHILTQALGGARSQQTADRIRKQLGLGAFTPEAIDKLGVDAIAVTGSDPFLLEGSDVTILVHGRNLGTLSALLGGGEGRGEHVGVAFSHRTTPDGAVNVYSASPRPDLHVRGNSLPAFKRVLETVAGKTADGRPVRRLGDTAEFKYVRTRMARGADEDGFVYLSDAFIRRLTGPQLKLTERRRVMAYNHLRMIGHAALLFRTEHGRAPRSLEELAETNCAPGVFGRGDLAHPDGGTYSLSPDGMSGVCSRFGTVAAMTPCVERLVTEVTAAEADEYKAFVADYSQYWRTFFDPIAVRLTLTPKQYRLETLVLPLIDNSIYTELARGAGPPAPMDLLPTPRREIGGVWVHLPKRQVLDILGPEQAAKNPAPGAPAARPVGIRAAAERTQATNDLKQIGLAFHVYHDVFQKLPDDIRDKDGKALLSWRVAILPYVEQEALYRQFKLDEPWDSAANKPLLEKMPRVFAGRPPVAAGKTPYVRPAGKGTAFPPGRALKLADFPDGLSNTVMAVEATAAVEWSRPADLPVDAKQPLSGLARPDGAGFIALLADGSVRVVSPKVDPAELLRAFDPADGSPGNLDDNVPPPPAPPGGPKPPFEVQNDLRQIGLAALNYESANGVFPTTNVRGPGGKSLLSWRVAILPYIEQEALYRQFKLDEPWDSPDNKKLIDKMPRLYHPNDPALVAAGKTTLVVPAGKNTLSPPGRAKVTIASITDGTSNTVLAVNADPARAVVWTKPDDLPFDPAEPLKGVVPPGAEAIDVVMADGSTKRLSPRLDPKTFAALVTPGGGEDVNLGPGDELAQPQGPWLPGLLREFRLAPHDLQELEAAGVDLNKLRRFLRDGIGDHVGFHMHDAPRLLDTDLSGLFGGGEGAGITSLGLGVRFVFGASSVSIPVRDAKVVDEYLGELDKLFLTARSQLTGSGLEWRRDVDFYRVPFPAPHTIRCAVVSFAGLKLRVYWGRIGDGLYVTTRPFILEDVAAAHAAGNRPPRTEPAHAVLRVRPENWNAVLPGYNLGWAEGSRAACHANLDMLANVNRGWNDRRPAAGAPPAELLGRVGRVYGERPFCPDGGNYELAADGRACRCSVHGGHDDPRQPTGPTAASSTGRLLKSFGGLTGSIRFEEDGLRVVVTVERKE
ncbi:MAG: DUF1559 domain-containing protein [Gemmataceae bacterium]